MVTAAQIQDAVVVTKLTKRYGGQVVVNNLSLTIRRGEIFGLLGPNGAGKTTLLEMIEGLRQPDSGVITVLGLDVGHRRRAVAARIGVQLQSTTLFPELTGRRDHYIVWRILSQAPQRPRSLERSGAYRERTRLSRVSLWWATAKAGSSLSLGQRSGCRLLG